MSDVIVLRSPDGHEFDVFEALPLGAAKGTIVVIQEIFGADRMVGMTLSGLEKGIKGLTR